MTGDEIYSGLSWFRKERVTAARVMVVGCGALGNEVLKNLVLFGIKHIVVVDHDRIEPSNLTRSILFSQDDAGRPKVVAVAERLRMINPEVEVKTIMGDIAYDVGLGLARRMDVVVGCVDSRWSRYCINRLCMRAGVPWIDGGIDRLEGTVRVFVPGRNCYACNLGAEGLRELAQRASCSKIIRENEAAGHAPTTPVIASIIGAVQVQEALKLIHRQQLDEGLLTSLCGKMFYYEGQHLTTRTVAFEAYDDDCPVHEIWPEATVVTSLSSASTVADTIQTLQSQLGAKEIEITLTGDSFVDYTESRESGKHTEVMCPAHNVKSPEDDNHCYRHDYHTVDRHFPYPELTLRQIGIPPCDILHITTEQGDRYIEIDN